MPAAKKARKDSNSVRPSASTQPNGLGLEEMPAVDEAGDLALSTRALLSAHLRNQCPWLKTGVLEAFLDNTANNLKQVVTEQEDAMLASKSKMSFMELSTELRNMVYELALVDSPEKDSGMIQVTKNRRIIPALFQVSRQVRNEAAPIYFGQNTFSIRVPFYEFDLSEMNRLMKWLQRLDPKHLDKIKKLVVRMDFGEGKSTAPLRLWLNETKQGELEILSGSGPGAVYSMRVSRLKRCGLAYDKWEFQTLGAGGEVFHRDGLKSWLKRW